MKETTTKVTVRIPTALLRQARAITGEDVTGTVRQGVRQIAAVHAQRNLRELRGKVPIPLDVETLRGDRDLEGLIAWSRDRAREEPQRSSIRET